MQKLIKLNKIKQAYRALQRRSQIAVKNNRGWAPAEILVALFIFVMLMAMLLNVFPAFVQAQTLNYMSNELVRMAEITGQTGTEVDELYVALQEMTGIEPKSITWEGTDYMSPPNDGKIQLNHKIKLTLKFDYVGKISNFEFPIEMTSRSQGRSEVYTK